MKKLVIVWLLAAISSFSAMTKTLRFATDANYAPFEYVGINNQIQGFDIDLANALCQKMQINCIFINQTFDSLIPSLSYHRCDAVISGMDITATRMKQVLFTDSYYPNSAIFVTTHHKKKSIMQTNLINQRIGTQNGSTHQKYLIDKHPMINLISYDSYQNAILDLKNGRLDGIFGDTAVVNQWLKQDNNLLTIGQKVTDKDYFGTGLGIAIRANNNTLLTNLNQALVSIKQDGTYQMIYEKWFKSSFE
ncbi:transporter substrate-binding domain-containing protein [Candidatus Palibaumannia cicadellinicola]|uniref:Arginine ABC transporter, periplasmic arginine-binding protein ArtI n=1 Tax=Candidatus Palibaumannia cicadellinicola TaxID=186490 RepID=A0A088MYG0_9GAMM|nr:transporter substrate-binding domain-containing protein [Candidatus Baumannia cicadellinicola]AIN47244.1 Arginine ABC transporter, periplasmic arginine-binding protein ArtI [Candidatus Baumannia cicadellinicola]